MTIPLRVLRRRLQRRCSVAIIKHTTSVGWWVDGYHGYQVSQGYHDTERQAIEATLSHTNYQSYYLDRH